MSQTLALTTFNNITVKLTKKDTQKDVFWLSIQHILKEVAYFKMMTSIEDVPDAVRNMFTFAQFIQFLKKVIKEEGSKLLKVDDCFNLIMKVPITILKQQKFIQAKITTVLDAETTFKAYMQRITFLNRQVEALKNKSTQKPPQTLKPAQSSSKGKPDSSLKPVSPTKPMDRPEFTSKPPTDLQTRSMINQPIDKKKIKQAKQANKKLNNTTDMSQGQIIQSLKNSLTKHGQNFVIQDKKIIINNEEYKIQANLVDRTQGKSITVNVTTVRGLYYFGELNDAEIMEFLSQPTGFSDSVALFGEIKHNCSKKAKQAIKVNEEQKKIELMIRIKPTKMNIDKEDTIFAEIDIKVMKKEVIDSQKESSVNKEKLVNDVQAALTSKTSKKPIKKGQNLEMSLDMSTDRFDDVSNYSFKTHLPPSKTKNTKAKSKQKETEKEKSIMGMSFDGMAKRGRKPKQTTPPKTGQKAK